jgi:hypothetical protein
MILWIASNLFVTMVSKIATWEDIGSYYGFASLCKWDCWWFASILDSGYDIHRHSDLTANWPFHPLHPLAAYPLHHWLKLSTPLSLIVASKIALLLGIYGFLLMLGDRIESTADEFMAGSLVAFNPYIIYAHAGYSEALYFALLTLAFYFARRQWWIGSGIMGGLVSATRMVGASFAVSYVIMALGRSLWRRLDWPKIIGLTLCPMGGLLYMLYLYRHTGEPLALFHVHVAWVGSHYGNPILAIWKPLREHHWPRVWALMTIAAFFACAWLFKLRKPELGTYLALSLIIALLSGSFNGDLYAMARYIWWQPPLLYAIYTALKRYAGLYPIYLVFASGLASFVIVGWFTRHNFVV